MNKGDKIISDLDGLEYEVVEFNTLDILDPLPNVKRMGNGVIVKDSNNITQLLYEWEVELLNES